MSNKAKTNMQENIRPEGYKYHKPAVSDEEIEQMNRLHEASYMEEDSTPLNNYLAFVSECYYKKIRFHRVLHYTVYNVKDSRELPLWEAIYRARALYRLLDEG